MATVKKNYLPEFFKINEMEMKDPPSVEKRTRADDKIMPFAYELLYTEFPLYFTWIQSTRKWQRRKKTQFAISRIFSTTIKHGELHYLRRLLNIVRGPLSFEDLRTVKGVVFPTFKDACVERGLLKDDKEWIRCLDEAKQFQSGKQLRNLFAIILTHCEPTNAKQIWEQFKDAMSSDILYSMQKDSKHELVMNDNIYGHALLEIEDILQMQSQSVEHYGITIPAVLKRTDQLSREMKMQYDYNKQKCFDFYTRNFNTMNK